MGCSFCVKPGFSSPRCDERRYLEARGCKKREIFTWPDLDDGTSVIVNTTSPTNPIDVDDIYISGNLTREVDIHFLDIGSSALDLYFLMDLSGSMKDDKDSFV